MKSLQFILFLFLFLIVSPLVFSQTSRDTDRKTYSVNITTPDTAIHAEVLSQPASVIANRKLTYYWYSNPNNIILHTAGGFDGKLLHGAFSSFYGNKNLMEKGKFSYGLKNGEWIKWFSNGKINEISHWRGGIKTGKYILYTETGVKMLEASFRNDKLDGTMISYQNGKILNKKRYKDGEEQPEKFQREKRKFILKGLFRKKDKPENTKNPKPSKERKQKPTTSAGS